MAEKKRRVPAAIRYNNPGAMWPGPSSRKFGSNQWVRLTDRQRNKIAVFPDMVSGAAAHFDLLNRRYTGKTLSSAIRTWSGNNSPKSYTDRVAKSLGISPSTVLTKDMLRDPKFAVPFAQSMAGVEAGRQYPMTPEQWRQAHGKAFGNVDIASAPPLPDRRSRVQITDAMGEAVWPPPFPVANASSTFRPDQRSSLGAPVDVPPAQMPEVRMPGANAAADRQVYLPQARNAAPMPDLAAQQSPGPQLPRTGSQLSGSDVYTEPVSRQSHMIYDQPMGPPQPPPAGPPLPSRRVDPILAGSRHADGGGFAPEPRAITTNASPGVGGPPLPPRRPPGGAASAPAERPGVDALNAASTRADMITKAEPVTGNPSAAAIGGDQPLPAGQNTGNVGVQRGVRVMNDANGGQAALANVPSLPTRRPEAPNMAAAPQIEASQPTGSPPPLPQRRPDTPQAAAPGQDDWLKNLVGPGGMFAGGYRPARKIDGPNIHWASGGKSLNVFGGF